MPNWKSLEAKDRLLAALVAAHPDKKLLDYRRIATYYGMGTTYDSIEGQFRIIRKEAAKLRDAVESGEHAPAPPRGQGSSSSAPVGIGGAKQPKTPRSNRKKDAGGSVGSSLLADHGVISGRITKTANNTPTKRSKHIKLEQLSPGSAASAHAALIDLRSPSPRRQPLASSPSAPNLANSDENMRRYIKMEEVTLGQSKPDDIGDFSFGDAISGGHGSSFLSDGGRAQPSFNSSLDFTSSTGEFNVFD